MEAKNKLTDIGQVLKDKNEPIFVQNYRGRVGQAVIYLGITLRTHNEASLNKTKRVDDTVKVVKPIQSLGLSVRDNVNIIKAAGQSMATYGAAVDPFTVAQINTLRGKYTQALWPKKYVACRTILVRWIRQTEGGLHPSADEHWDEFKIQTGNVRGPINYFRGTMQKLGWKDNTPTNITDHNTQTRDLGNGMILSLT
eukprot:7717547-Heterocapsa_arctica.AAC.1